MAYTRYSYQFDSSIEYEFHFNGRYGLRTEKRAKKTKPTAEAVKKYNQKIKANKVRRLIKANFKKWDYWITLKYPKGTRKEITEVKKDIRRLLDNLRRRYKKQDKELKFIYRIEIGAQGGIHCHMILPRLQDGDKIIQECWKQGRVFYESLYEQGGYDSLASYIVKQPTEEVNEQLSLFQQEERKHLIKYSTSRNLIRPEPEKRTYMRWTMKKLIDEGPKATNGYYIDKDSIKVGVSQWTGRSYLYYTEIKIKKDSEDECQSIHHDRYYKLEA